MAGWSSEETSVLVGVWGGESVQRQLDSVARNRSVFENIAKEMKNLGYDRSWQQCKTKIKNLTHRYRKVG